MINVLKLCYVWCVNVVNVKLIELYVYGYDKKLVDKIWRIRYWYYENIWLYYILFNYIWYLVICIRLIIKCL